MRRTSLILFVSFLLAISSVAHEGAAQEPLSNRSERIAQISKTLRASPIMSGRFVQEKTIAGIREPLLSPGYFLYWRDKGLYWALEKPAPQAITFMPNHTLNWRDDHRVEKMSTGAPSFVQTKMGRILLSLFSGDLNLLDEMFDLSWQFLPSSWSASLIPTQRAVRKSLKEISFSGREYIDHLVITSRGGDLTEISFHDIQRLEEMPADQCKYFSPTGETRCPDLLTVPNDKHP